MNLAPPWTALVGQVLTTSFALMTSFKSVSFNAPIHFTQNLIKIENDFASK
jgi:hypothetical protein